MHWTNTRHVRQAWLKRAEDEAADILDDVSDAQSARVCVDQHKVGRVIIFLLQKTFWPISNASYHITWNCYLIENGGSLYTCRISQPETSSVIDVSLSES